MCIRDRVHLVAGGTVGLDQVEGLGIDDGLDGLLERLPHDLPDQVAVPALGQGEHRLPHPGQLLLAGPEVEIDDLGDHRPHDQAPVDEAAPVERPAEGGDGRLGDDRLVQVEERGAHRSQCPTNSSCTASSASAVTRARTSSPTARRVSPRGTTSLSDRTTATTVASRGNPNSARLMPAAGESSARVTSTRWALPPSNRSRRTRLPTETASSTRAVSSCGVDTDTSTPQLSVNSHWFFGWLTRATTRGTANSCLARRETTRLSSSSPVAATTTSTVASPAASRDETSQASATTQVTSRSARMRSTRSGSRSMTSTSWPLAWRSEAMAVPTLPAPAMATLMGVLLSLCLRERGRLPLRPRSPHGHRKAGPCRGSRRRGSRRSAPGGARGRCRRPSGGGRPRPGRPGR